MATVAALLATACDFTTGQLETALCSNGIAVTNPTENVGLVDDCAALLRFRDRLAGQATLNWSARLPMADWEGVGIDEESTPLRVTEIRLDGRGLTGELPPSLGSLSQLEGLWLHGNRLTGKIPAELGSLDHLEWLWVYDNRLTGEIPTGLGALAEFKDLASTKTA